MKSLLLFVTLVCAVVLTSTSLANDKSPAARRQKATAQFTQPVIVQGLTLKGEYLFVHDDGAMPRGEACTRIYKGNAEIASNLVVEFHCVPIQRDVAKYFIVRTQQRADGLIEVNEFQFKGDTEAHALPPLK
ncbi:MAG TPA: hypothetical protein VGP81_11360 [Pyrinomonadaceae bacterium]|jgi:hypothetical protein|nr:hypothetical protein [Pyrinomonadaceae bacterium]